MREGYEFQSMTDPGNEHVFKNDEYLQGARARVNAGHGLWQPAFGSKADLTAANHAAARAAMMDFRADGGRVLGVRPTVLVVPPSLEDKALRILNTENDSGGGSNPWKGTAELIVSPRSAIRKVGTGFRIRLRDHQDVGASRLWQAERAMHHMA